MELVENFLTKNPCYQAGKKIAVKGLMLHSVGCSQPSAEVFVKRWNSPESSRACVHAFIDGNTGAVIQTLPWDHRGWHGGGSSNNTHIGVEMCEPACIHYISGSSFTCSNPRQALEVVKRTYDTAVELFAMLCKKFGLNPLGDGVIVSHKEGHERGIASDHGDPEHLWKGMSAGYTMDGFRRDVAAAMGNGKIRAAGRPQRAETNFGEGDTVRLVAGAVYYSGKVIPDWVVDDVWVIKSISGDRAVIDRNDSGTSSINSPVNVSQLVLVAKAAGGSKSAAKAAAGMQISAKGVDLVAKYEGCYLDAYKCPAGVWTIGYGHTGDVKSGDKLPSKEAAWTLLKKDLTEQEAYVNSYVKSGVISFALTQNQFDALTSFCYNCGCGSLKRLVSGRNAAEVAEKMLEYNKGGGKVLAGLVRRREEERQLFLSE